MSIARFSVRQGVMVNLLFFVCVLAGLLAYVRTPVDFFPDISFNVAVVTTVWTGASADEVERLVTSEIEDEIDGIDGIKDLWSQSNSSLSTIAVQWEETLSKTEQEFVKWIAGVRDQTYIERKGVFAEASRLTTGFDDGAPPQ